MLNGPKQALTKSTIQTCYQEPSASARVVSTRQQSVWRGSRTAGRHFKKGRPIGRSEASLSHYRVRVSLVRFNLGPQVKKREWLTGRSAASSSQPLPFLRGDPFYRNTPWTEHYATGLCFVLSFHFWNVNFSQPVWFTSGGVCLAPTRCVSIARCGKITAGLRPRSCLGHGFRSDCFYKKKK